MAQLQSTTLTGTFTTTGNVGIGTTSVDSYRLNIAGNTNIAGTLTATSISMGGNTVLTTGNYTSYAAPAASFKALGTNVSYDVDRTVKTSGGGLAVYTGYSSGANRPFTYDIAAQFASANGIAFEIAADWISTNSTPLRVRSLRDCCQNWSSWSAIATSNESFTNKIGRAHV